jgi:hypothetical protein
MPVAPKNGVPYVEVERHDELSSGVPTPADVQAQARAEHKAGNGRIPPGARALPALGGKAMKGTTKLSHRIEAGQLSPVSVARARTLRKALSSELASGVGGGRCGVAASLFLKFAAQKTAAAEEAFAAGDYDTHRKLSESARMDILYAREHAAKEAAARPRGPVDPLAAYRHLPPLVQPTPKDPT